MKRTFPNKTKSVPQCELHTKAGMEETQQTNTGSSKTCSSVAMIGLAAISTTVGASSILFLSETDCAVATELPQVDTNQLYSYSSEVRIPELNFTRVNSSTGLLPKKLGYLDTHGNDNPKVAITQSETVLLSGQKRGDESFFPVELKQKSLNIGQSNKLLPLGSLSKVQLKKSINSHGQVLEQLKTGISTVQKQKKHPAKSSEEWKYEEFVFESIGKPFELSKKKFLEKNTYQKSQDLAFVEASLETTIPKLNNSSGPQQVTEAQLDISQESIKIKGTKQKGVVVLDSDITYTPVSLVYKVRVGDTLSLIANQHNVSIGSLAQINQITDPDIIEAAKLLKIPQQPSSTSLTLPGYRGGNYTHLESNFSGKQESAELSQETTKNQSDFREAKIPTIRPDYLSHNISSISEPLVLITDNSHIVSESQATDQDYQINHKSKEFIASEQSVSTHSPKIPSVNGKVWPTHLESKVFRSNYSTELESQIHLSNNQLVHPLPVKREIQDGESTIVTPSNNQENPYANRLRSEITRLQQEYNDRKHFEESQLTNSESIDIPVPLPLSSRNNLSVNHQVPIDNGYLKPTYQQDISQTQTRQWSEGIETNQPERRNSGAVMEELLVAAQTSESQESSLMAAAPTTDNAAQILNSPSIGKMVSPDWPPLGKADTYLPSGSMEFTGYTWPARGTLTSGYGWRWGRMHRGIDIAAPTGTPIVAAAPGIVTYADWNSGGYGNLVEIQHPNGSLTIYAHNSKILVRKGQTVSQGELIAKMGSTGRSSGPHLHFEIHTKANGAVNPMAYLPSGMAYN